MTNSAVRLAGTTRPQAVLATRWRTEMFGRHSEGHSRSHSQIFGLFTPDVLGERPILRYADVHGEPDARGHRAHASDTMTTVSGSPTSILSILRSGSSVVSRCEAQVEPPARFAHSLSSPIPSPRRDLHFHVPVVHTWASFRYTAVLDLSLQSASFPGPERGHRRSLGDFDALSLVSHACLEEGEGHGGLERDRRGGMRTPSSQIRCKQDALKPQPPSSRLRLATLPMYLHV